MKIKIQSPNIPGDPHRVFTATILSLLLINALILKLLGVGFIAQAGILLAAGLLTLSGRVLLGRRGEEVPDSILLLLLSFLIGVVVFTGLNFILLHFRDLTLIRIINFLFYLLFLIIGIASRKHLVKGSLKIIISRRNIIYATVLALLMSLTTAYGFLNQLHGKHSRRVLRITDFSPGREIPNWGWNKDKQYWLRLFTANIAAKGLPETTLYHNGVPVFFLSLAQTTSSFSVSSVVRIYKGLSLLFFFCLLYSFAFLGKYFFPTGKNGVTLTLIAVPFFAAINYPLFRLSRSSYLGFFPAGATMYHNITQLMGLTIGVGGIILFLLALNRGRATFPGGCFLIAGSFFFKPSLFSVAVPILIILVLISKRVPLGGKLLGYFFLLIPPLFWKVYPALYPIPKIEVPIAIQPFRVLFHYAAPHFPRLARDHQFLEGTMILLFSFAVFVPILMDRAIGCYLSKKAVLINPLKGWRNHLTEIFFPAVFLCGILSYALLVQDSPQMIHGNLAWGAAVGYLLFIPLLVKLMLGIRIPFLRFFAYGLFCLHLWGGIYHLYRFAVRGTIF